MGVVAFLLSGYCQLLAMFLYPFLWNLPDIGKKEIVKGDRDPLKGGELDWSTVELCNSKRCEFIRSVCAKQLDTLF